MHYLKINAKQGENSVAKQGKNSIAKHGKNSIAKQGDLLEIYSKISYNISMSYLKRYVEEEIKLNMKISGVVLIAGPKWCGKSTTSKLFVKSSYILDTKAKIELANFDPYGVLIGDNPRLIDEWQFAPDLWNAVRNEIDSRDEKKGQFIFTGSSTPVDKKDIFHNGAGRISKIKMYPLTLAESLDSKGIVSLNDLFEKKIDKLFYQNDKYTLLDTGFYMCRGGWPESLIEDRKLAVLNTKKYCNTLFDFENSPNTNFRNKKKDILMMLVKSYARNISTEVKKTTLKRDILENDSRNLDDDTFDSYLEALQDLYIFEDIEHWNPNFRSKTTVITTPTRHFVDTSIALWALKMSPSDLLNDPKTFGLMFEDFAIKELKVYSKVLDGEIRHYRDNAGLECDAVIHLEDGRYALIEIKLGDNEGIKKGCKTLNALEKKLLESDYKAPSFKAIITASGMAYKLEDIFIIPINILKV